MYDVTRACVVTTDVPQRPEKLQVVDVTKRSAVLSWRPPSDDGGSPVTGYRIEHRKVKGYSWEYSSQGESITGTSYTVTGLKTGAGYNFRVAAINKAGNLEHSVTLLSLISL